MKNQKIMKRLSWLCLSLLLLLSLAACDKQSEEQESQTPTPTAAPTPTPTPPIPYTDVTEDADYYDAVVWAYENGIASDGETFDPDSTCTRGQVITFIWRAAGSPEPQTAENPISDITPSDWFYKPVLWAWENGIVTGSTSSPGGSCTNAEALTFLWRAEGKPMAAVSSSAIALAASGAYYDRPAAWADNNGLFAQTDAGFDPTAPCSRAYLMSCLYWADGRRASAERDRTLQAEYEQIINDAQLYEVYGSGLVYADYVDVEGDGKTELLTVDSGENLADSDWYAYNVTATIYASIDGHAGKLCEQTFEMTSRAHCLYICTSNAHMCLHHEQLLAGTGIYDIFWTIENGAFVVSDSIAEEFTYDEHGNAFYSGQENISEAEYNATAEKYTNQKELFWYSSDGISIHDRGILPTPGVEVNGTKVELSVSPYVSGDMFMVPLQDVLEAMGVAVYANSDASVILASTKSDTLVISYKDLFDGNFEGINSTYYGRDKTYWYSLNGGGFLGIAIEFIDGKACMPLQAIVPLFGAAAEWDGKAGAMQIASNIPDSDRMGQDELKKVANFDMNQASKIAVNKGYKGPEGQPPTTIGGWAPDDQEINISGGLVFKNGKAIWSLYVVKEEIIIPRPEDGPGGGYYGELYRIDVASDGTVTAYPDDKAIQAAGAF